jgi:hypothetical protein
VRRRSLAWIVAATLGVAGSQAAHALAYVLAAPAGSERAELLRQTGHGYLSYAPFLLALGTVAVLLALVSEARLGAARRPSGRLRLWPFAAFAPLLFICQEHAERLAHDGSFPWSAALEPSFGVGLLLQAPLALLAYLAARLLLHAARALGLRLGRPEASVPPYSPPWTPAPALPRRRPALASGCGTRGPPLRLRF